MINKKKLFVFLLVSILTISVSCKKNSNDIKISDNYDNASTEDVSSELLTESDIINDDISSIDFNISSDTMLLSENISSNTSSIDIQKNITEIKEKGTYIYTGEIKDKTINVDADISDEIFLVLENASIINTKGPALFIKNAAVVNIIVKEGTHNSLSDGVDYSYDEDSTTVDAVIYSKSNLNISGEGTLNVIGNYKHGIVSKNDLIISSTNLNIKSKNVSLNGKNCIKIGNSEISIESGSDGIRSDNTDAQNYGFIYLNKSNLSIKSVNDAVQSTSAIKIDDSDINIKTGIGYDGEFSDATPSSKGFKAGSDIIISSGNININSTDDCIHSDNTITIKNGNFELNSADDAIHADTDLCFLDGKCIINNCSEGYEGSRVLVSGGYTEIHSNNNGINASIPSESDSIDDTFNLQSGDITVSGGYIYIDTIDDGINAKGTFNLSGGTLIIIGELTSGSKTLNYDKGAHVSGGTFIALGGTSNKKGFETAENQAAIYCRFATQPNNSTIALCNESNEAVIFLKSPKEYCTAIISSKDIIKDKKYNLICGSQTEVTDQKGFAQNVIINTGSLIKSIKIISEIYE